MVIQGLLIQCKNPLKLRYKLMCTGGCGKYIQTMTHTHLLINSLYEKNISLLKKALILAHVSDVQRKAMQLIQCPLSSLPLGAVSLCLPSSVAAKGQPGGCSGARGEGPVQVWLQTHPGPEKLLPWLKSRRWGAGSLVKLSSVEFVTKSSPGSSNLMVML